MLSYGGFQHWSLKIRNLSYTYRVIEQLFTSSYIPLVLGRTRITQHTATLIDNIFTNDIETIESSTNGLIFCDISDHLPIVHIRSSKTCNEKTPKTEFTYRRIVNNTNIQSFSNTIKNMSWENVLSKNNTLDSYNEFLNLFSTAYE